MMDEEGFGKGHVADKAITSQRLKSELVRRFCQAACPLRCDRDVFDVSREGREGKEKNLPPFRVESNARCIHGQKLQVCLFHDFSDPPHHSIDAADVDG